MKGRLVIILAAALVVFTATLFMGPRLINPFAMNGIEKEILLYIRLPRVIVSILMGAALGASGARGAVGVRCATGVAGAAVPRPARRNEVPSGGAGHSWWSRVCATSPVAQTLA